MPSAGNLDSHLAGVENTYSPTRIIAMGDDALMPAALIPLAHRLAGYLPKSCPPEMLQAAVYAAVSRGAKLGWTCMGPGAEQGQTNPAL